MERRKGDAMNALAQNIKFGDYSIDGPLGAPFSTSGAPIGPVIGRALPYVFAFAGIGLLLMIIRSGFTLMLSAGDAKKMEKGKATLTNAIIGFILIFVAFWVVQILGIMFGWQSSIGTIFGQ